MEDFELLKLNRAIWVALLEEGKVLEAASFFDNYLSSFQPFSNNKKYSTSVYNEATFSQDLFVKKLAELGIRYINNEEWALASICYTVIFKYDRLNFEYIKDYLKCLKELQQYDLQMSVAKYLTEAFGNKPETYEILADVCASNGDLKGAISNYKKYLEQKDKNSITAGEYNNMGHFYFEYYRKNLESSEPAQKAMENFKLAADMEPGNRLFCKNVTVAAGALNDYVTYMQYCKKIMDSPKANDNDRFDYAAFALKTENFEDWHKYYEYRFTMKSNPTEYPKLEKPKWDGKTNLSNKTLLIYCEQGFGDMFLAWGYVQRIANLAKHTIFVVQNEIAPLLKNNPWGVEVISKNDFKNSKTIYDYHIPAMSIMTTLKLTRENISTGGGYITPPEELVQMFKEKYFSKPTNKLKIGISFAGNITTTRMKNLPMEYLKALDELKNVELYLLQKGADIHEFDCFKHNKVIDIERDFKDFAYTAAAMSNLDLVLSIDNCIMNLAGAMGIKTFALFNWSNDYRWFDLTGEDVIYYPTVKPFVNDKQHNWKHSINLAINEIKKLTK